MASPIFQMPSQVEICNWAICKTRQPAATHAPEPQHETEVEPEEIPYVVRLSGASEFVEQMRHCLETQIGGWGQPI